MSLFAELKRPNVIRMAGLYLGGAWLLVQVAGTVLPIFGAPGWGRGFYYSRLSLGEVLVAKQNFDEAISENQKARELNDDPFVLALLGHVYASSGKKAEALKILEQLEELSRQRYVSAYSFVVVCLGLGDKEEALRSLEQSYQDRAGPDIGWIRVDSLLDPLHGDPRFEALAEKIVPAREFKRATTSK